MAHDPLSLVERLSLHPIRRKPNNERDDHPNLGHRVDGLGVAMEHICIWLLISGATLLLIATMLMSQVAYRKIATAQNVMIVMVIGGLWHGAHANFVTWAQSTQ